MSLRKIPFLYRFNCTNTHLHMCEHNKSKRERRHESSEINLNQQKEVVNGITALLILSHSSAHTGNIISREFALHTIKNSGYKQFYHSMLLIKKRKHNAGREIYLKMSLIQPPRLEGESLPCYSGE